MLFAPGKASNAGGVSVSGLEMSQNSMRYSWTFEEVDRKLEEIMKGIFHAAYTAAEEYGCSGASLPAPTLPVSSRWLSR